MAYNFTKSDGTAVSIPDNQVVSNQFSLDILGRNVSGYGLYVARNFVRLLEHFASGTAPTNPTKGQVWYDTTGEDLKVYDGTGWKLVLTSAGAGSSFVFSQDIVPDVTCTAGEGVDLGTASLKFCNVWAETFNGTSTQARYADLAERYESDKAYLPGTVVKLGGDKEITVATDDGDVFGVISTKPAYLMNSEAGTDITHPAVALVGRVPVMTNGVIKKFDKLVMSNLPGVAQARTPETFDLPVIGRALTAKDSDELGLVEISLGAK